MKKGFVLIQIQKDTNQKKMVAAVKAQQRWILQSSQIYDYPPLEACLK